MLGRKSYIQEEFDRCEAAIDRQLAAYQTLVKAGGSAATDQRVKSALEARRKQARWHLPRPPTTAGVWGFFPALTTIRASCFL